MRWTVFPHTDAVMRPDKEVLDTCQCSNTRSRLKVVREHKECRIERHGRTIQGHRIGNGSHRMLTDTKVHISTFWKITQSFKLGFV